MAKKDKVKKDKVKKTDKSFASKLHKIAIMFFLVSFIILFSSSALYFFICMLPTVVAIIVDPGKPRTLGVTVGAMNLAGSMPNWGEILNNSHDIVFALSVASTPSTLLQAYGAAAIGWLLYFFVTRFIAFITLHKTEIRLETINKHQNKLIELWGEETKDSTKKL